MLAQIVDQHFGLGFGGVGFGLDLEPADGVVEEFVRGDVGVVAGALLVEGPAVDRRLAYVALVPFGHQRGFAGAAWGDHLHQVRAILPGVFECFEFGGAADQGGVGGGEFVCVGFVLSVGWRGRQHVQPLEDQRRHVLGGELLNADVAID